MQSCFSIYVARYSIWLQIFLQTAMKQNNTTILKAENALLYSNYVNKKFEI